MSFVVQLFPIQRMCVLTQSCPALQNPTDYSQKGSSVPGIFQARILEQVAISFFFFLFIFLLFPMGHNDFHIFLIQNCQKQTPLRILELFIISQCTRKYIHELFLKSRLKIYKYYIYISLDCFYKIPQTGSLINDRNPFLIVMETESPRSDGQHGQVLVRTASRVLIFNFSCVLT